MPLIQVKLIEGVFDASEKEAIIEKLTDAMMSVEGEAATASSPPGPAPGVVRNT
jgi:phenylpyruvate tautomerase PptA (4-oxalocrotonate tautomerase family)